MAEGGGGDALNFVSFCEVWRKERAIILLRYDARVSVAIVAVDAAADDDDDDDAVAQVATTVCNPFSVMFEFSPEFKLLPRTS